jgi:hypothetical protein
MKKQQLINKVKKTEYYKNTTLAKNVFVNVIRETHTKFSAYLEKLKTAEQNNTPTPQCLKFKHKHLGRTSITYKRDSITKQYLNDIKYVKLGKTHIKIPLKTGTYENLEKIKIIPLKNKFVIEVQYNINNNKDV